jgi:hypothetical protein
MKTERVIIVVLLLILESTHYRLDWYTPLTTGGGGVASSPNYQVEFTTGQAAVINAGSTNYQAGLGYWQPRTYYNRVPLVPHNSPAP